MRPITSKKAQSKTCPYMKISIPVDYITINRTPNINCLAQGCMAWHIVEEYEQMKNEVYPVDNIKVSSIGASSRNGRRLSEAEQTGICMRMVRR